MQKNYNKLVPLTTLYEGKKSLIIKFVILKLVNSLMSIFPLNIHVFYQNNNFSLLFIFNTKSRTKLKKVHLTMNLNKKNTFLDKNLPF